MPLDDLGLRSPTLSDGRSHRVRLIIGPAVVIIQQWGKGKVAEETHDAPVKVPLAVTAKGTRVI
ncbi:hypothetical protein GB937_004091 [Aspergillus fischeri]|nr:hypothetical protein GB937_004091 [Aspergillus fischeri]